MKSLQYNRFDSSFLRQQLIEKNREILHLKSEKSAKKLQAEKQIVILKLQQFRHRDVHHVVSCLIFV